MSFIGSLEHMDFIKSEVEYEAMSNRELQDLYSAWKEWYANFDNMRFPLPSEFYFVQDLLSDRLFLDDPLPTNGGIN